MFLISPILWNRNPVVNYEDSHVRLSDILPRKGVTQSFNVAKDLSLKEGKEIHVIWTPPVSEINGWSEQPSELAHSYVVTGIVKRGRTMHRAQWKEAYLEEMLVNAAEYELSVSGIDPLLSLCATAVDTQWQFPMIGDSINGVDTSFLTWDEVHWSGTAKVGDFLYLCANAIETRMELLLKMERGEWVAYFHGHFSPGGDEQVIGRKRLSYRESRAVESAICRSQPLQDTFKSYLIED